MIETYADLMLKPPLRQQWAGSHTELSRHPASERASRRYTGSLSQRRNGIRAGSNPLLLLRTPRLFQLGSHDNKSRICLLHYWLIYFARYVTVNRLVSNCALDLVITLENKLTAELDS